MPKRSRFSSRDRLLRLHRLRRDSSRPVGADASLRVLDKRAPRKRRFKTWILTPLIIVALLFMAGYFYVRQTVDVERIVRLQVVPQLEKQLGARVEIGRIESDYISGVTLHDIVIGRDAKLPLGALAQIKSATLGLDLPALALRRTDALGALRSVELDAPRVVVTRDARGQINWAKLWKSSPSTSSTQWIGTLTAKNGRVWYQDATIRTRRGASLVADAQNVALQLTANGSAPATFSVVVPQAFVGRKPQQTTLKNLSFDGSANAKGRWASVQAKVARVPVALLVDYADIEYSKTPVPLVGSGEIGAVFQIAYDANALASRRVLLTGRGAAFNAGLAIPPNAARLPVTLGDWQTRLKRIGANVSAQKINGDFAFSGGAFSSDNLSLQALGGSWKLNGAVANQPNLPLTFDLRAQTQNADTTRFSRLFPIDATSFRGGLASGNLRITGDANRAQIGGDFSVPNVAARNANWGDLGTRSLRVIFQTDSALRSGNARFSASQVEARNARGDFLRHRVLDGTATFARNADNAWQVGLDANAPDYTARRAGFGAAEGNALHTQIAARLTRRDGRWNGQGKAVFRTTNLVAQQIAPNGQKSFARATNANGTLDFSGEFSNVARANATLNFDSSGVATRGALLNGTANAARGSVDFRGENTRGALSADVAFADLNAFPQPQLWRVVAPQTPKNLASQVRAREFRVLVSTNDVRSTAPRWNGVASFAGLDARRFDLGVLSPDLARRVGDLGEAKGRVQFTLDGKTPVLQGDFGLSRARIDTFSLRQIVAKVIYRNGLVQLRNARAQSDEGPLLLDANYDLKTARGNLGLNAPFVQIDVARINPFLRGQKLQLAGVARGQLRLTTSLNRGASGPLQATFDLGVPNVQLRSASPNRVLDARRDAVLNARDARLQGRGVWQNGARGDWKFLGQVEMRAQNATLQSADSNSRAPLSPVRLGNFSLPGAARGAQIFGLRLVATGEIARAGDVLQPRISGVLSASRATANLPSSNGATRSLVAPSFILQDVQARFTARENALQVARWQAQAPQLQASSPRRAPVVSGFLNLQSGALSGQVLARDLDAARVQRLADYVLPSALRKNQPALRGVAFARAELSGTTSNPRAAVQARLYRGAVAFSPDTFGAQNKARTTPISISIDAARLDMNLGEESDFTIQQLVLWSKGGRLALRGTVARDLTRSIEYSKSGTGALKLDLALQMTNWRVRELTQLLQISTKERAPTNFDGALSGDFLLTGTTIAPRVSGKAALKLATWNGVDVPQIEAQILGEQSARGPRLLLTNINGRVEDASVAGGAAFDIARNVWSAQLRATDLPAERLVRLGESLLPAKAANAISSTRNAPWRVFPSANAAIKPLVKSATTVTQTNEKRAPTSSSAFIVNELAAALDANGRIPLHGKISAVLTARGDFGANVTSQTRSWSPILREAHTTLLSPDLRWRGRELGALNADLSLRNGVVYIGDFSLLRRLTAREIAFNSAAQKNAGVDAKASDDGNATVVSSDENSSSDISQIRAEGSFPLDVNAPNAVPFDTSIAMENERFTFLRSGLQELGRVLAARRIYLANLDILLRRLNALPTDLEGRLNATTRLGGRWGDLSVALDANIDNARTSTQSLPALQTSLVFVNGEIQINNFEIKQTFEENSDGELTPATDTEASAIDSADGATEGSKSRRVRETALRVASGGRIVPNGDISLDVDVLKANLAQLAGWLPELKMDSGKALLRGELSLFSFEVRGKTASPEVTGSIEARNLSYKTYTLDRFRVAQFEIKNGVLSVEPGKLTVVKGGFQSSAANGSVPWSWGENGGLPGPKRDGVLNVNFPLQTKDFGALAGAFVPALTNVAADGFSGSVNVSGTLDAPLFAGEITLKNARFRTDPVSGPFPFGVNALNGSLRFVDGNRVLVEGLNGQLARAETVKATATGNRPAAERALTDRATNTKVVSTETDVALRAVRQANAVAPGNDANLLNAIERPDLAGKFTLGGEVTLDLEGGDPSRAGSRLPFHRYDLDFTLRDGAFRSVLLSGLREISLDASWKTGEGAPQLAQTVSWKMNAKGRPKLSAKAEKQTRGTLVSVATIRLAPNFTDGVDALLRSRFDGDVKLQNLGWEVRGLGAGVLDGDLKLDNGTTIENAIVPQTLKETKRVPVSAPAKAKDSTPNSLVLPANDGALTRSSASMSDLINGVPRGADAASSTRYRGETAVIADATPNSNSSLKARANNFFGVAQADESRSAPLRISGALTISQTEIAGFPTGGSGGADFLASAPNFDIAIATGKEVRFTTPTLRAEVVGSLAIAGTPRAPRISGVVSTRNGQIRFPNASARIEEGTVEIEVGRDSVTRQLRPRATIEATARGQVGRYAITIGLHGPLDLGTQDAQNLRVDVTSNPPLSQDEAFAQLTGTSLRDLATGNPLSGNQANQAYARAVVGLLSAPLFSGLERSLEQTLGLSSLTLDYRLNEPLGIEVGKAIGDRIFVTYRRSLARGTIDQPSSSVRVDFRIAGGVQLGVEGDSTGRKRVTIGKTFRF